MIYIGNYSNWIDPLWIEEVLSFDGFLLHEKCHDPDIKQKMTQVNDSQEWLYLYEKKNLSFNLPQPPWTDKNFDWWITKMYPGQFLPMHHDPGSLLWYGEDCKRYWIPLMDYQPGHIFIYEDTFITDYKMGDVYCYTNSTDEHGAANVGFTTRIMLQITELGTGVTI